jgi:hypothetical protein
LNPSQQSFFSVVNHPLKFPAYLLYKLPAAFFSGIKIREVNEVRCITSVPYRWLTQNPFRSTYFASLAMAAEMSTGMLALSNVYKRTPPISMLVTKMEAVYFKKAIETTFFRCENGKEIAEAIDEASSGPEPKKVIARSTGFDTRNDLIAEFLFTWSFKSKPPNR